MHHQPELGIKDPYELTDEQYQAALDLLRQQRAIVNRYWHDAFVQIDDFTNEGVVASSSWPFQVNILRSQDQPIASTVPEEGATGWADTTMMHAEAPHPNCAYKWMEWTLALEPAGRSRVLVRLGAGGARRLRQERAARPRRLRDQRPRTTSTRSTSGARRSPNARARPSACPTTAGSPTTSPCSAAAEQRRAPVGGGRVRSRCSRRSASTQVSRHFGDGAGGRRREPRGRGRRVLRDARTVGLGQDHLPAPDRRLRGAGSRARSRCTGRACSACRPTIATSTPCSRTTRCSRT